MKNKHWILVMVLILSGFVHLLNPVGFPDIFFDEGVYMRRAMHVIQEGDPQEAYLYDHPYFGQMLLAGAMKLVGFPESLNPSTDAESLKELYMAPRIFMGLLAVLDTFLIYRIAEKKYNKNVAIIASVLFAVMPFSWVFKRILLDSLLLPFLLGSILVALHAKDSQKLFPILSSGILLGLAVFTKVPAVMFAFVIGTLVYQSRKRLKDIAIWFAPVFLIPSLWVLHAIQLGWFDLWIKDVFWQVGRESSSLGIAKYFFEIDPVLFVLGLCGIVFAGYKRDYFVLLWTIPMVLFLAFVGFTQYFHWIPLIPIFCISASAMIVKILERVKKQNPSQIVLLTSVVFIIFGMASTIPLIMTDVSASQFEAMSFALENTKGKDVTILASPVYTWIFDGVFDRKHVMMDYAMVLYGSKPVQDTLLIADTHFMLDVTRGDKIESEYNQTKTIKKFDGITSDYDTTIYPYGSFKFNLEGKNIHIRTNYEN